MSEIEQIKQLLENCSEEQRQEIFSYLRNEFPIHPIEAKLNIQAEVILEAIDRASDLTLRGVRGVIAEAAFEINVINKLVGWYKKSLTGNFPYDYLLEDSRGEVSVQVKMQRLKNHIPMMSNQGYRFLSSNMFVVETQRTRGGKDKIGQDTRPYRFGEFDILAVSMQPSTNSWNTFMYTVSDWLLSRPTNENLMLKFQPVSKQANEDWTDSFDIVVKWFRSGEKKKINK
jgi:hypothetical protein